MFIVVAIEGFARGVLDFSDMNPVEEKSLMLDFKMVLCSPPRKDPINSEGLGRFIFLRELGLWLMSGRKDSPVLDRISDLIGCVSTLEN